MQKKLYETLDYLLEKQETAGVDDIDFKEIWFSAKARPFTTHILGTLDDVESRRYLLILSALIALTDDSSKKTVQIRFLARVLASCENVTMDLKELVADGLLFQNKNIDEFQEIKKDDVRISLLIDLLLLTYLDGDCDEKQLDFAIGFMALIGLDKEKTKAVGMIVKGILEQNDDTITAQVKYINIQYVYCYMKNSPDGILVCDLEKAKTIKAEKVIFLGIEWKAIPVIYLDEFLAKDIEFNGCTFRGVQGLDNREKNVILKGCSFLNCEVKDNFLCMKNTLIADCKFGGISTFNSDEWHLIFLQDSKILRTEFENITLDSKGYGDSAGFMKVKNCEITKMTITGLVTEGCFYGYRRVIDVYGGRIYDCRFNKCRLAGKEYLFTFSDNAVSSELEIDNLFSDTDWNNVNKIGGGRDIPFECVFGGE